MSHAEGGLLLLGDASAVVRGNVLRKTVRKAGSVTGPYPRETSLTRPAPFLLECTAADKTYAGLVIIKNRRSITGRHTSMVSPVVQRLGSASVAIQLLDTVWLFLSAV
ncbi:hypothetical protein BDW22DRAFT_1353507 [Trametopsis cervina]|nr:hypothetical protein BDW22DRAFT_1353507 [Trametopsis cervina]